MKPESLNPSHPALNTPVVWHPTARREGYVNVLFRRRFELKRGLRAGSLWVSAAQRFILFLDGKVVARGPSRADPFRWGCVHVTLPVLKKGRHVLAARVFHMGKHGGKGQLGGPAFFLLHSSVPGLSTESGWACFEDRSRMPVGRSQVGSGERVDGGRYPWGLETGRSGGRGWVKAKVLTPGVQDPWGTRRIQHDLRLDPLPLMEERPQGLIIRKGELGRIPANSRRTVILDHGELTNAYPVLAVSGGKGATIRMTSAEAPFVKGTKRQKGNRDRIKGKVFRGLVDEFLPDGGPHREFTTLWFHAFRYLELKITTKSRPLTIEDVHCRFTGYTMKQRASFRALACPPKPWRRRDTRTPHSTLPAIWQVSWLTQRLCSHETFFDCPQYEQGQFPGDSRIQAVFHYLVANDDRLARKAIDDFHASRNPEGLLSSHYPLKGFHHIPTSSLYWIGMLHDFLVYRGDGDFLRPYVPHARQVLAWFQRHIRKDGLLGLIEQAPFIDWSPGFRCGNPPQEPNGGSSILTLLTARACQWQADLETACGFPESAPRYWQQAKSLVDTSLAKCGSSKRGLLADTSWKRTFSVQAQVEAVLAGAWPKGKARKILLGAMELSADGSAQPRPRSSRSGGSHGGRSCAEPQHVTAPGTFYYRYYLSQALRRVGSGAKFFELLKAWEQCFEGSGLTTWPETSGPTPRSDCHAWPVTPAIEFLQTILGG